MNKPVNLGISILELGKILMYEFWYDYIKPKYDEKAKFCYLDKGSFIAYLITKVLQKILKLDLMLQIMNQMDHCLKKRMKS